MVRSTTTSTPRRTSFGTTLWLVASTALSSSTLRRGAASAGGVGGGSLRGRPGEHEHNSNSNDNSIVDVLRETITDEVEPAIIMDNTAVAIADGLERRRLENLKLPPVVVKGQVGGNDRDYDDDAERFLKHPHRHHHKQAPDDDAQPPPPLLPPLEEQQQVTVRGGEDDNDNGDGEGDEVADSNRIVNGESSQGGNKAVCMTMRRDSATGAWYRGMCGCQAISRTHVLLAAHCVSNGAKNDLKHYFHGVYMNPRYPFEVDAYGNGNKGQPFQLIPVTEIIEHPLRTSYGGASSHDIMIAKLEYPLNAVFWNDIPRLPNSSYMTHLTSSDELCVKGLGQVGYNMGKATELLEVCVPYVPDSECQKTMGKWNFDDSMMCAGGLGDGDSCGGDSGGPLNMREKTGGNRITQVGVVSWGYECNRAGYPGVYAKVSEHLRWIITATGNDGSLDIASAPIGSVSFNFGGISYSAGQAASPAASPASTTTTSTTSTTTTKATQQQAKANTCEDTDDKVKYVDNNKEKSTTCAKIAEKSNKIDKMCALPLQDDDTSTVGNVCCDTCQ